MYLEHRGKKVLLVNDLEYGRAGTEAKVDEIVSTTPYEEKLRAAGEQARLTSILDLHLKERGVRGLLVPASFPFSHAERLRELGYSLRFRDDPFFLERTIKRPEELHAIEETQRHTEEAMDLAVTILRKSEIRSGALYHRGKPLTADDLRLEIHKFLLGRNCQASYTIVAGGDQGADPHGRGTGPLHAGETIIIDIFPRSLVSRYWGDMTRTCVRGEASPKVRKLHADVLDAQSLAFSLIKDGADGQKVHEQVLALFKERGNLNEEVNGKKTGFIHSTGHGIGLEIHEPPRIGRVESKLLAGQVVTVEPGLYYPGVGAVRLEDVVVITAGGCRNLNTFPKDLEL
jgi:Xaa-Pro aminopeptidase